MKKVSFILLILMSSYLCKAQTSPYYIGIHMNTYSANGYTITGSIKSYSDKYYFGWDPDGSVNSFIGYSSFNTPQSFPIYLNSPKIQSLNQGYYAYWGIYEVTYTVKRQNHLTVSFTFQLNLLDENWSVGWINSGEEWNYDLEFSFIESGNDIQLWATSNHANKNMNVETIIYPINSGLPVTTYANAPTVNIWSVYDQSANQNKFKVPVPLQNLIEGTATQFGYLKLNGATVNTGNNGYFRVNTDEQLEHGTLEQQYNGKRQYSFKWDLNQVTSPNSVYSGLVQAQTDESVNSQKKASRKFNPVSPLTVKNNLDGTGISAGSILFKDPVFNSINGYDIGAFASRSASGSGFVQNEVFENFNEEISGISNQKYSLKASGAQFTYDGSDWYYLGGDFNPNTATDFLISSATTKQANYKGHLRTGQPTSADAKNQRRVVYYDYGSGTIHWAMVYESMGEIWLTISTDNGATWKNEYRLSAGNGTAKNPSLSNVIKYSAGQYPYVGIVWVENNQYQLRTLSLNYNIASWISTSGYRLGWYGPTPQNYSLDYTTFIPGSGGTPDPNARPVLELMKSGNNLRLYFGFEEEGSGIQGLYLMCFNFTGNGSGLDYDLASASISDGWQVTTSTNDKYPVILFDASHSNYFLYYATYGSSALSKINQFKFNALDESASISTSLVYSDVSNGTINGVVGSARSDGKLLLAADVGGTTQIFTKPYYYSTPSLSKTLSFLGEPSITAYNSGSNDGIVWTKYVAGSPDRYKYLIGSSSASSMSSSSSVTGIYANSVLASSGTSNIMVTKSSSSPSVLEKKDGNGSSLAKIDGISVSLMKAHRFWLDQNGDEHQFILDFNDSNVDILEDQEGGTTIGMFKLNEAGKNGVVITQNETERTSLGVEIIRDEKTVRSFSASEWIALSSSSVQGLEKGDIIKLKLPYAVKSSSGFEEISINPEVLGKLGQSEVEETAEVSVLKPTELSLSVYPNPFNPQTNFRLSLPELKLVTLEVYNMLGQKVKTLVNGKLDAGDHVYQFDGANLATGTYIYRFISGDRVQSGKIVLVK